VCDILEHCSQCFFSYKTWERDIRRSCWGL